MYMFNFVGALTSKPYAFTSRPWEISSSESFDFFDSFFSEIRIDEKNTKIIRILPVSNSVFNDIWISDRIRFFYNSQINQRVFNNFVFYNDTKFVFSNLRISIIFYLVFSKTSSIIHDFGIPTPLEFQISFYNFSNFYNFKIFNTFSERFDSFDFRSSYCLNSSSLSFNWDFKVPFFVNFNTRFSVPTFNVFLKSKANNISFPIFFFFSSFETNFSNFINLGSKVSSFINFISSKNKINKIYFYDKTPIFFSKNNFFYNNIGFIHEKTFSVDYNFSQTNPSKLSSCELNYNSEISLSSDISRSFYDKILKTKVSFNSNFDFFDNFNNFKVSFNSNFDFFDTKEVDFIISFPFISEYSFSMFSVYGEFKTFNFSKVNNSIYNFFFFFDFFKKIYFYDFKDSNFYPIYSNVSIKRLEFYRKSKFFSFKNKYFSDFFHGTDSYRSHFMESSFSKFSVPLMLQFSKIKKNTFNHKN